MSFLDNIREKKAGGSPSGSSFLENIKSKRLQPKDTAPLEAMALREQMDSAAIQPPDFTTLEAQSMQGVEAPNQKTGNPFIDIQKTVYKNTLNPVQDFLNRLAGSAVNTMTFDITKKPMQENKTIPEDIQKVLQPPQTTSEKTADVLGSILGFAVPGEIAYRTGGKIASKGLEKLAPQAPKLVQNLVRGAGAGATFGTVNETADALLDTKDDGEQTIGQRAKNVAIDAALFGAGDAAISAAGIGLKKAGGAIKNAYNDALKEGPVSGFSAFAKKIPEKLSRPKEVNTVRDMIDVGGTPKKDRYSFDKFMTDVVDELRPLKKATEKIGGKNIPIEKDPFKQAWLSRGWRGKADTKLEYGIMDNTGNKVGKSLKEVLEPFKGKLDDLREYAVAKRSFEYEKAGLESGIPKDIAEQTIKRLETPEFAKAYDDIRQYITDVNATTLVDSGIWSPEKLMQLRREQPNYIPMFRTQEKGIREFSQSASNKRFGNQKDPTKSRTGSFKPIIDPIESIIKQTYKNTSIAEKNNVMKTLVELAESNPENALIRPVQGNKASLEQIQKSLDDILLKPTDDMEKGLKDALDLFTPQNTNGKKNVFTVMRNGKAEQWEVADDELAKVIGGLNDQSVGLLAELLGKPTGMLKAGLVLAPEFVTKNLVRDQASAFINSKYGFIPYYDFFKGLASAMKKDDIYYKWMSSGGANGAWVSLEREYLQGQIRQLTKSGINKIQKNPMEWLRKFSELSEQATRIGEFKRGIKKGASLQDAALAARDVTLDFSRIGSKTKGINKAVAFFNVAVQSMDKMARQFKEYPAKTTAKAITSITLPSVLLYMLNHKNEKYQELPQWERDTYWHIPLGDTFIKIPKPFEMGVIFGTYPEKQLQFTLDNDPKAFDEFSKTVLDGFTPSVIPTLFMPWIEAFANKDNFTGSPIVPKREENLLKPDQYGAYTSETGKYLGRTLDQSPRIIDNYITGYTGTLGKHGLEGIDALLNEMGAVKQPPKPDKGLSGIPGLSPFISKSLEGGSKSVDEFYKERDKLTKERGSAKKNNVPYKREADYKRYNKIGDLIGDENARIRQILDDMNMTPEEKRTQINQINLRIINLARSAKGLGPIK